MQSHANPLETRSWWNACFVRTVTRLLTCLLAVAPTQTETSRRKIALFHFNMWLFEPTGCFNEAYKLVGSLSISLMFAFDERPQKHNLLLFSQFCLRLHPITHLFLWLFIETTGGLKDTRTVIGVPAGFNPQPTGGTYSSRAGGLNCKTLRAPLLLYSCSGISQVVIHHSLTHAQTKLGASWRPFSPTASWRSLMTSHREAAGSFLHTQHQHNPFVSYSHTVVELQFDARHKVTVITGCVALLECFSC